MAYRIGFWAAGESCTLVEVQWRDGNREYTPAYHLVAWTDSCHDAWVGWIYNFKYLVPTQLENFASVNTFTICIKETHLSEMAKF